MEINKLEGRAGNERKTGSEVGLEFAYGAYLNGII